MERNREARAADRPSSAVESDGLDGAHPLVPTILESLPDMVFAKDAESLQFIAMNHAGEELLGWSRTDLLTRTDHDFFPNGDAERFRREDRAALVSGTMLDLPAEPVPTRNGTRLVHTKKIPVCDNRGKPLYLLGISRDITDRHKLEQDRQSLLEELRDTVRARDQLLALVSHDLRSPLNAILLSTQALERDGGTTVTNAAQRIQRAVTHMNQIIANLVDAGAVEAGQFRIDPRELDIQGLVNDAIQLMLPLTAERDQRLELRSARALPRVVCDRDLVLQVFTNLVGNASKFTPEGGSIVVAVALQGRYVRFDVIDTGPGISPASMPYLFERFWQEKRSSSASAGLGLYIVKGIIEAHGGRIWAESPPGGGAVFSFLLPCLPPPAP